MIRICSLEEGKLVAGLLSAQHSNIPQYCIISCEGPPRLFDRELSRWLLVSAALLAWFSSMKLFEVSLCRCKRSCFEMRIHGALVDPVVSLNDHNKYEQ